MVTSYFIKTYATPKFDITHEPFEVWTMFVDGASGDQDSGIGILLISPHGDGLTYALSFSFKMTNNESNYETLLSRLCLA